MRPLLALLAAVARTQTVVDLDGPWIDRRDPGWLVDRPLNALRNDASAFNRGELSRAAIEETKARLCRCVVGNIALRHDETLRVLAHWFPWLEGYKGDQKAGHHRGKSTKEEKKRLSPQAEALIRSHNALDVELYEHAMEIFERQIEAL